MAASWRFHFEPRYIDFLIGEGLSDRTVAEYRRKLARAQEWCDAHDAKLTSMRGVQVRALAKTFPQSMGSLGQLRAALKYYWEMIGRRDSPHKAIRLPAEPIKLSDALSPDDARALVKTSLGWWPEGGAVLAGLYMALRREEIATLRWDKFDRTLEWYEVLGKGDKVAPLPVHPVFRRQLEAHTSGYRWVFPGRGDRQHVTGATINLWVDRVTTEAGIGHVNPHRLRHTALTTVHDGTKDLRAASVFARHSKVQTTMRYTRTTSAQLVTAMEALDYLSDR